MGPSSHGDGMVMRHTTVISFRTIGGPVDPILGEGLRRR